MIAGWLIRYDVARRTIKSREWPRYSAYCLLTGYGWLIAAGFSEIIYGLPKAGLIYDAQLHIFSVGFVFSMIFAHAAVIIPMPTGKNDSLAQVLLCSVFSASRISVIEGIRGSGVDPGLANCR